MKRLAAAVCAAILVFTACSSGGGGAKKAGTKKTREALAAAGGDFCDLARNIQKLNDQTSGGDDTFTPEEIADFRAIIEAFVGAAPDEIKADAELLGKAAEAFLEYLEITGGTFTPDQSKLTDEQKKRIEELQKQFSDADTAAAGDRVNSFTEKKCGIDMDRDGDTDGDPNTSGTPPQDTGTEPPG